MMDNSDLLDATGCDVVTRKGEIDTLPCYHRLPFICKVEAKDAPYDRHCDVYGKGKLEKKQLFDTSNYN